MKYAFNVTRICFTLKGKNCSVKLPLQGKYYFPIVYYNEGFLPSAALHRMLMCDVFKELLCLSSALLWLPPQLSPPLSLPPWCRLVRAAFRLRGFLCSRVSQVKPPACWVLTQGCRGANMAVVWDRN